MTVARGVRRFVDHFDRNQTFSGTAGHNGWTLTDVSAAGAPTALTITEDIGAAALTLAATSEAEILALHQGGILTWDLRKLHKWWCVVKVAAIDAVSVMVAGVGSAHADDEDTMTVNAWFKIEGSASLSNLVAESDDNTIDNDDKATGATLAAVYKKLEIDFTLGLADVRFYVDGARVAEGTTFNMSAVAASQNVQPYLKIEKASGTGVPALTIAQVGMIGTYGYGA